MDRKIRWIWVCKWKDGTEDRLSAETIGQLLDFVNAYEKILREIKIEI